MSDHWDEMARRWAEVGHPLRPGPGEVARLNHMLAAEQRPLTVLVLGATAEYARLAYPPGSRVIAVDRSEGMLRGLWRSGQASLRVVGLWESLPLVPASVDWVLCDGGLSMLQWPAAARLAACELRRVVRPGGRVVIRLYTHRDPACREGEQQVMAALQAGEIQDLNEWKLRMWLALDDGLAPPDFAPAGSGRANAVTGQGAGDAGGGRGGGGGVAVDRVWQALASRVDSLDALADRLGWMRSHLRAIEAYRGSPARYWFPSEPAVAAMLEGFVPADRWLGDPRWPNCPTVLFVRKSPESA